VCAAAEPPVSAAFPLPASEAIKLSAAIECQTAVPSVEVWLIVVDAAMPLNHT
jgi:hypothetical protein